MTRAPHAGRCLARLADLGTPVVQVWGWPGSGRSAVLAALLERPDARALAPADLSDAPRRRRAVAAAHSAGSRWLVLPSLPREADPRALAEDLAEELPADCRLVFASRRRVALPELHAGLLGPRDLALDAAEVAALLAEAGG
ncbi:MAG TPA: hypothetical protein VJG13_16040, partial [Thermoanaerobaculia bacterium]|nr:hypothetical protein [Thermoanaerobaculia bacterium]